MKDWSIRPHCETDEKSLLALFTKCFNNSKLTRAYRLYNQNPDGQAIACNAVTSGQVVIGQYALILMNFLSAPKLLLSVHTATHSAYGRRGIFGQLAVKYFNRAAADGYAGVENGNSIHTFINKLDFNPVGNSKFSVVPPLVLFDTNPIQTLFEKTFQWRMQHPSRSYIYSSLNRLAHTYMYFKKFHVLLVSSQLILLMQ